MENQKKIRNKYDVYEIEDRIVQFYKSLIENDFEGKEVHSK